MSNPIVINTLEELQKFLNEKGILEIVQRGQRKQYKTFQKVMINNLENTQQKELTEKVLNLLNQDHSVNLKNMKLLSNVATMGKLDLIFNGLNLCATCAGFAIMYVKLNQMSAEINGQLKKIQRTLQADRDITNAYEYNKVLSDHMDMLDRQRRQQPYSEEKMRELVDREYNVLYLLIGTLQEDISGNHENLIVTIIALLAMFTVSLCKFDEIYYFNNHEILGDNNVWHLSHIKWMDVYDTLSGKWFLEKLQDYGFLEKNLSVRDTDTYCENLLEQVKDYQEEIVDNQIIIASCENEEVFKKYKEISSKELVSTIRDAYGKAGAGMDMETIRKSYEEALRIAAIA